MAKLVKRRRGSTIEHSTFIGSEGEITIDLDKETVVVHDGSQVGGYPLAREDLSNVNLVNRISVTELNVSDGTNGQLLQTNGSGVLSFATINVSGSTIGGDLSGTVGNAQIVAGVVGTSELATDAVTTIKITDSNVTNSKLATDSVSTVKIIDDAVTTSKLINNSVTTSKITDSNVTETKLATGSVSTVKIIDSNVTAIKLANNSVLTSKIADGNVTDIKIDTMSSSKLTGALPAIDGSSLTGLPYDTAFTAGFDKDMLKEDLTVATYGELVMSRTGLFVDEAGYIDTAPTGSNLIVDIEKNGTTIYSSKPFFAIGSNTMTPGTLSITSFGSGDRITLKVTQIGSTLAGQGVRFTLNGKV